MNPQKILIFSFSLFLMGCSIVGPKSTVVDPADFVRTYKIVDPARFAQGGKITVVPFQAGQNAEANDALDKVALMIIKGLAESINQKNPKTVRPDWEVITSSNADDEDFIITGYITSMATNGNIKNMIYGAKEKDLAVEAKMIDKKTGEIVVVFNEKRKSIDKKITHKDLGFAIGEDIGQIIINEIDK